MRVQTNIIKPMGVEDYQLVSTSGRHKVHDDYEKLFDTHLSDPDTFIQAALRRQYPELNLTVTSAYSIPLLRFATDGYATADLDIVDEDVQRFRDYRPANHYLGNTESLVESRTFAKYSYRWGDEFFIVYIVRFSFDILQYILKEPGDGETIMSTNSVTDTLIRTVGRYIHKDDDKSIYVYDGYWSMNRDLYDEIQKANWEDVILNEDMKKTLTELMTKFFDSKDIYQDLGVPWKRGVIFHGPAGNGKTVSIKALMHSLFERAGFSIPSLYVKSAPRTYDIRNVFITARKFSPCLLIFEDIDTIVTPSSRSYFFNEVDGLENNDGLFMVASTNHLDRLDPGLSSRPSRFDRKYLFPLPNHEERVLYCEYWRKKLKSKPAIKFPEKLSPAIAEITEDFSFAYLKEAFVATLLVIAGKRSEDVGRCEGGGDDLNDYELWREIKKQVKLLRDDMGSHSRERQIQSLLVDKAITPDDSWKEFKEEDVKTVLSDQRAKDANRQTILNEYHSLSFRGKGQGVPDAGPSFGAQNSGADYRMCFGPNDWLHFEGQGPMPSGGWK